MAWIKRSSQLKTLAGLLALGLIMNPSVMVLAQSTSPALSSKLPDKWEDTFNPPGQGSPEGREGGATRGPEGCIQGNKDLTPLVPPTDGGYTIAENPTFYWYLPPTTPELKTKVIEFKLQDENDREIYSTKLPFAPSQQGIMSYQLPASSKLLPLEINRKYSWQLALICGSGRQASPVQYAQGFVMRVKQSPSLAEQARTASRQEQLALYAKSGLWYETLNTLVELRRLNPNDPNLAAAWTKLLKSVDLESIAQEPMVVRSATELQSFPIQQTNNLQIKHIQAK